MPNTSYKEAKLQALQLALSDLKNPKITSDKETFKTVMSELCGDGLVSFTKFGEENFVNPSTIYRWEKGESAPSAVRRSHLVEAARKQVEDLIKFTEADIKSRDKEQNRSQRLGLKKEHVSDVH